MTFYGMDGSGVAIARQASFKHQTQKHPVAPAEHLHCQPVADSAAFSAAAPQWVQWVFELFMHFTTNQKFSSFILVLAGMLLTVKLAAAQQPDPTVKIDYRDRLLSLSAENVDITEIFRHLAAETGITISFPATMQKKISIQIIEETLPDTLRKLLIGLNHSIVYSTTVAPPHEFAQATRVYVFGKAAGSRSNSRSSSTQRRLAQKIQHYERRILYLKKAMEGIHPNSVRYERYSKRLKRYENLLDRLNRQIR